MVFRVVKSALALLLVLAAPLAVAQFEADSAHGVVEATSTDMLELIETSRAYVNDDPERFYTEVENLLAPVVDFQAFARGVMARHYKDATPEQRTRFAETFRSALVRTYALALTEFREGEVVVLPSDRPPKRPDRDQVKMEIRLSAAEVYPVVYSMAKGKDGQWRVRNIVINGINMGLTYRNQFASAVSNKEYGGDLDKVIEAWGAVVAEEAEDAEEGGDSGGQA